MGAHSDETILSESLCDFEDRKEPHALSELCYPFTHRYVRHLHFQSLKAQLDPIEDLRRLTDLDPLARVTIVASLHKLLCYFAPVYFKADCTESLEGTAPAKLVESYEKKVCLFIYWKHRELMTSMDRQVCHL